MKRLLSLITIIIFILTGLSVDAKIRTSAEVLSIAEQHFTTQRMTTRTFSSGVVKTILASEIFPRAQSRSSNGGSGGEPFYVLVASDGSNVIVSGDDQMPQIIGYSQYEFDKNNVNDGLKALLSAYSMAYNDIQATGTSKLEKAPLSYASKAFPAEVKPLLDGIAWDQAAPYNGMSPTLGNGKKGFTGCVTTATAMVMRYHQYPERATGRGVGDINDIDLSERPFDWANMLKTYAEDNVTNPEVSRNAVAWLMRACGAALGTEYYYESSGSGEHMIAEVLANNFGYDQGVVTIDRSTKTHQQWIEILNTELSSGRPMVYSATELGSTVGHAIVIDGYNTNGLYYVNWGWTRSGNGYYDITSLGGYSAAQGAVIGIQKPRDKYNYVSHFIRPNPGMQVTPTAIPRDGKFELKESWEYVNLSDTFTGQIGLVLFQNGKFVSTVGTPLHFNDVLRNYSANVGFKDVMIPSSDITNGRYELYVASKDDRESQWQPVMMEMEGSPYYLVDITPSGILFSNPVIVATPRMVSFTSSVEKLYQKQTVTFKLKVQNDGTESNMFFRVMITSSANHSENLYFARYALSPGLNEIVFSKEIIYTPGEYKLDIQYSRADDVYSPLEDSQGTDKLIILDEDYEQYDYYVIASYVGLERETVSNKDKKPRLIVDLVNVGAKDINTDAKMRLLTNNSLTNDSFIDFTDVSIKKGATKRFVMQPSSNIADGDGYTFRVQFTYPLDGTKPKNAPSIKNAQGSYSFGVRTLGNGK